MRALVRAGWRAEALDHFARLRDFLLAELGEEPGPELQALHQRILRRDPILDAPAPAASPQASQPAHQPVSPRQLPRRPMVFVGRGVEVRTARTALLSGVPTVAFYGSGGAGKSTATFVTAYELAEHYPDGQLYIDLRAARAGERPLDPTDVLGRFLRAVGIENTGVTSDLTEAAALFRSVTSERRILVVLDNAADAAQVRPLLPAGPGCGALVTSRRPLTTLDDAVHIGLATMDPDESIQLLTQLDVTGRCAADPTATAELADLCGHLPLALRIAAARLLARPTWPVRPFVERLSDRQRRLDELSHDDLAIRACLDVSYHGLIESDDATDRDAARAFRLFSLPHGSHLSLPVAARLLDRDPPAAEALIERLLDHQLLESPVPGRYRMHDLTREYAREVAERDEPEPDRHAALDRAWACWTATVARAAQLIRRTPTSARLDTTASLPLADRSAALAWTEEEYPNLVAAARQAATCPDRRARYAITLVTTLGHFQHLKGLWAERTQLCELGIQVARRFGEAGAVASLTEALARAHQNLGNLTEARELYDEALEAFRSLDDRQGMSVALNNLASLLGEMGQFAEATKLAEQVVRLKREIGDTHGEAIALLNAGTYGLLLGQGERVVRVLHDALDLSRRTGDALGQAVTLNNLAEAYLACGAISEATRSARDSLNLHARHGNRRGMASALTTLGRAYVEAGALADALEALERAKSVVDESFFPRIRLLTYAGLAHARRLRGDAESAVRLCEQAIADPHAGRFPYEQAISMWRLGEALDASGKSARARWFLREAYERLRGMGVPKAEEVRRSMSALRDTESSA